MQFPNSHHKSLRGQEGECNQKSLAKNRILLLSSKRNCFTFLVFAKPQCGQRFCRQLFCPTRFFRLRIFAQVELSILQRMHAALEEEPLDGEDDLS